MDTLRGKNKLGDNIVCYIGDEEKIDTDEEYSSPYEVIWYGLCGATEVKFELDTEEDARALFRIFTTIEYYEVD